MRKAHVVLIVASAFSLTLVPGVGEAKTRKTVVPKGRIIVEKSSGQLGFNALVNTADDVVIGKLVSLSIPLWNSIDGKPWTRKPKSNEPIAFQYRRGVFAVEERVAGRSTLQTVNVIFYGSGEAGVAKPNDLVPPNTSGTVAQGQRLLLILKTFPVRWQGGKVEMTLVPHETVAGIWRIEGDRAISEIPERTAPLAVVRDAIRNERSKGMVPTQGPPPFVSTTTVVLPTPISAPVTTVLPPAPLKVVAFEDFWGLRVELLGNEQELVYRAYRNKTLVVGFGANFPALGPDMDPVLMCVRTANDSILAALSRTAIRIDVPGTSRSTGVTSGEFSARTFATTEPKADLAVSVLGLNGKSVTESVPCHPV
jgi:hypothetical protein